MFGLTKKREYLASEVHQKLRDLQNTRPNSADRKTVVLELFDLFCRSPTCTNYCYDINGNSVTALHCFLKEGEGLHSVKTLCQLCPRLTKLLRTKDNNYDLPIHVACQYSSPFVIEYLIRKTPNKSLKHSNTNGYLACHHALLNTQHEIPMATFKELLRHYKKDCEWDRCWSLALLTGKPTQLLELMLEKYPNQSGYLNTFFRHAQLGAFQQAQPLNLGQAAIFTKLCQTLKRLSFHYKPGWDCNAFVHFLNGLKSVHTLTRIEGITLPNLAQASDADERQDVLTTLQNFLQQNTGVTDLSFYLQGSDVQIWHSWTQATEKGLAQNTTLESLKFDNCFGDSDSTRHTVFSAKLDDDKRRFLHPSLENFDFGDSNFIQRLQLIPHYTNNLQSLTLSIPFSDYPHLRQPRNTKGIAAFVRTVPGLKELQIRGYFLDPAPIFEALYTHPSLTTMNATVSYLERDQREEMLSSATMEACLTMVRDHNLNLLQCYPWSERDPRIGYHLDLNRFGRKEVRNATSCTTLVKLLTAVHNHKSGDSTPFHENRQASMRYGLLREIPTLWSGIDLDSRSEKNSSLWLERSSSMESESGVAVNCGCMPGKRRSSGLLRRLVGAK